MCNAYTEHKHFTENYKGLLTAAAHSSLNHRWRDRRTNRIMYASFPTDSGMKGSTEYILSMP